MYLSRIQLDRSNDEVRKALSSPQVMHAILANCLPASNERSMWRIDQLGDTLYLLLQSHTPPIQPSLSNVQWETHAYQGLLNKLENGQIWRFRLCANPVHSIKTSKESRGKVFAHVTVDQQKEWLLKKAPSHGFSITMVDDEYQLDVVERDTKKFKRKQATVTLGTAVFEGILKIEDVVLFVQTLENGIGRGKAYGCGLLTLARM